MYNYLTVFHLILFSHILFLNGETPKVLNVEYQTKTVNLLSTTLELAVIEATVDQELYRLDSVICAPYDCAQDTVGCLCDYTHGAVGGCGSSTDNSCTCEDKENFCSMSWLDLEEGIPQAFNLSGTHHQAYRYFLNECKAVRVNHLFFLFHNLFFSLS
jgi:hypothetical protein